MVTKVTANYQQSHLAYFHFKGFEKKIQIMAVYLLLTNYKKGTFTFSHFKLTDTFLLFFISVS